VAPVDVASLPAVGRASWGPDAAASPATAPSAECDATLTGLGLVADPAIAAVGTAGPAVVTRPRAPPLPAWAASVTGHPDVELTDVELTDVEPADAEPSAAERPGSSEPAWCAREAIRVTAKWVASGFCGAIAPTATSAPTYNETVHAVHSLDIPIAPPSDRICCRYRADLGQP
jgi:hypothetical protein